MEGTMGTDIWVLAFFLLFGMGGSGFGNTRNVATQDDLNFSRQENQVRANAELTERKADGIANGIASLGYELERQFGQTNAAMATGFCNVDKEILDSRYQTSKQIDEAKAEILGVISQNKIESLQAQVSELKTQNMFCGIPRINPYGYGVFPYQYGCGCNGGNI